MGISIPEVYEMNIFMFWFFLREAMIYQYQQTEDGRKYLEDAWRITQTEPDRKALRESFGKGA